MLALPKINIHNQGQQGGHMSKKDHQDVFTRFTTKVASVLGHAWIFVTALIVLVVWALSGPLLGFSDTWQLIINTSTTIITFLMVFIIQNTQNRDNLAINIKLDSMMKKLGITDDDLLEAEEESDKKLEKRLTHVQKKSKRSQSRPKRRSTK
jgi:low affinity Fe/Cu permease